MKMVQPATFRVGTRSRSPSARLVAPRAITSLKISAWQVGVSLNRTQKSQIEIPYGYSSLIRKEKPMRANVLVLAALAVTVLHGGQASRAYSAGCGLGAGWEETEKLERKRIHQQF